MSVPKYSQMFITMLTKNHCILRKKLIGCNIISAFSQQLISEEPSIIVKSLGQITTIGLNRPEKRNCIDSFTAKRLYEVLQDFENDDNSYVGVIHGLGGNFCSGKDLKEISDKNSLVIDSNGTSPLGLPRRLIKKPLVAAISGYAVAGGFELALMCDLRVVEDNAIMGLYNRRFGIPCINGGTVYLPAMVGLSRALDLILTGRSLTAQEAFQLGIANRIVACGTALGQAIQLAGSLLKFPQACLLQDRLNAYTSAFGGSIDKCLINENEHGEKVINEESIEGAKKFIELGIGKHGKSYYLKEKEIPHWEKE